MDSIAITNQLHDLQIRAKKIDYKNQIPKLPNTSNPTSMMGFRKRLANWTAILKYLETERLREIVSHEPLLKNFFNN